MASATKCDRCGAFYDSFVAQGFEYPKPYKDAWRYTISRDSYPYAEPDRKLDLCPNCRISFLDWLRKEKEA
jgi:hypothetical protein